MRLGTRILAGTSILAMAAPALAAGAPADIIVTAPTPLAKEAGVQAATAARIEATRALDLTNFLVRTAPSVTVTETQGNPLQPDVNYRGFTASPLLGTPQGLSVYLDGVRVNQPFGDVVSWDLIPRAAIRTVEVVPGSNPLFGRNTLGGAIAIRTRDGRGEPKLAIEGRAGSFGRRLAQIEVATGGDSGFYGYATANRYGDDGWRDSSPTRSFQSFAKGGWADATTDVSLSGGYVVNHLTGNGLQEMRLLNADRSSVYTKPDETHNRAGFLTATLDHRFSDSIRFVGNAYWRRIATRTYNGDINEGALGENVYQPSAAERTALTAAGFTGFPTAGETQANTPFPKWRCIANALLNSEPNEKCNALINRTRAKEYQLGGSGEFRFTSANNVLAVGGVYEASRAHFTQSSQFGYLTPDRGVIGVTGRGAFADGSQDSENAFDARVNLIGRTYALSGYATDTFMLTPGLGVTASVRYDRTIVRNSDRITPGGGSGSLDGHHRFDRVNPAVALTYQDRRVGFHATLSQSSRAPSAIELGCADPANPCRLPNALAGDPPLKQVVARTGEIGGSLRTGAVEWNANIFRIVNRDDILFVASDATGFGYFRNFGKTRRQGIEAGATARFGKLGLTAHYTYLDATYRSEEAVNGEANSSRDGPAPGFEGEIEIGKGDRIPLVPRHIFKAGATLDATDRLTLSADMVAISGSFARGNENGEHKADGVYYLGSGRTKGYAVVNGGAEWRPVEGLKLFVEVENLFDKGYATAAQLGVTAFDAAGRFVARPFAAPVIGGERPLVSSTFYAPGAPRSVWVGAKVSFGK
ncbi:TonB-dependent receptor [Sphingomonas naphthae]|uniref:TonB-dependent receptor n=1 Tax=Sphingomonas naphthae TaxID=1813468 RepID=A0ABY7TNF8_9SPHN|nr:TonB-dependent receptor [Sphingomonas naphthae]WCT73389.1 TonB-dependent receptor [Sphingomonas naphthae]